MKRLTSLLFAVVMLFSVCLVHGFAADGGNAVFSDMNGTEYYAQAADVLKQLNILNGYPNGTFGAEKQITRAEMAAVICRAIDKEADAVNAKGKTVFDDVSGEYWASGYIAVANAEGIVSGDGNGKFRPEDNVKYEEAIKMVVCAMGHGNDVAYDANDWSKGYLEVAEEKGISDNLQGAKGEAATRGDVAVMTYNGLATVTENAKIPATPVASKKAGEYKGTQKIKLTTATEGATIYYTTNGRTPTVSSTRYRKEISISKDTTLKAIAVKNGIVSKDVMSVEYNIKRIAQSSSVYYMPPSDPVPTEYTVSFDLNYSGATGAPNDQIVGVGEKAIKPEDPTREGYNFAGWYERKATSAFDFEGTDVNKDYILYAKWMVASDTAIQIALSGDENPIITDEEAITITGTITGVNPLTGVTAVMSNHYVENKVCDVTGIESWSIDVELEIGTNKVTLTATDDHYNVKTFEVIINRNNKELVYSNNVKFADEQDYQQLYDEFVGAWNDDNNTPNDESDDSIILLIEEDSLLLSQIKGSLLLPGEVYMIPQNSLFVTGFTGIYRSHRTPEGNENFSTDVYTDDLYEEIVFSHANIFDLFDTDISMDLSDGIDENNPISFAMMPDGTKIEVEMVEEESLFENPPSQLFDDVSLMSTIGNSLYSKAGWITDDLKTKMLPKISVSLDRYNRLNASLKWSDVVLYDHDGIKNDGAVDYGQIKLSGEFYIKNFEHSGGIEWHPSLVPWDIQILPQQVKSKLTYNWGGKVQLKADASVSTDELVSLANGGFENKAEFFGLTLSGVDTFDDKIVFGIIGLNLTPPRAVIGNSIRSQAAASTLSPSLVVFLFLGLDGQISAEAVVTAGYDLSAEKGFNIQKNGYTGSYGSQAQNRSDKHYILGNDYTLDVYDKNDGNFILNIAGKAEASLELGLGAGGGLLIGGLCPATVDAFAFARANGKAEGQINLLPELGIEGEAALYAGVGWQANIKAAISAKCAIGTTGINASKHFEGIWWETTLSTANLKGTVYKADGDSDNSNNVRLDNAKITLKNNDTGATKVVNSVYDETEDAPEYTYKITNIPNGSYTLTVEKEGYETYINRDFRFSGSKNFDIFLNEIAQVDGICKLSGKITIADSDTNMTNNVGLEGAKITISSVVSSFFTSTYTASNGTYEINDLAPGNYRITVEKANYITIYEAVSIADNTENYYNATIEAINEEYSGNGNASGTIYDAINGQPVAEMTLIVRSGIGIINPDEILKTLKTSSNGTYSLNNFPAGNYTVEIIDNRTLDNENLRYRKSTFVIKILGDHTIPNQNGYITNNLSIDQLRVVLRWGEHPRDLDSHLVGPTGSGGRFHVYFSHQASGNNALDHDDVTSYGPETITIYEPVEGVYTYLIHDYTNKNYGYSDSMANSGAYIEVYYGITDTALARFDVPDAPGTVWTVFQFDSESGRIIPINTMSYESNASRVGNGYAVSNTQSIEDVALMSGDFEETEELKDYEKID